MASLIFIPNDFMVTSLSYIELGSRQLEGLPLNDVHGAARDALGIVEWNPTFGVFRPPAIGDGDFTSLLIVANDEANMPAGARAECLLFWIIPVAPGGGMVDGFSEIGIGDEPPHDR